MPPPSKRRRLQPTSAVEEITFNPTERHDYLTGFHKRKVARTKAAQEAAAKRAREEKIADRKRIREERKRDLERAVEAVDAAIRPVDGVGRENEDEDEESQSESEDGRQADNEEVVIEPVDHEAEYVDEDKYTSVVVEEMDVTREGLRRANDGSEDEDSRDRSEQNGIDSKPKRQWTRDKPKSAVTRPKQKRKKFRYESKAERKVTRDKQRSKNREQAKARRAK